MVVWSQECPAQPVSGEEEARIKDELHDRSFRQFEPSRDGSPRKGVILDFFRARQHTGPSMLTVIEP